MKRLNSVVLSLSLLATSFFVSSIFGPGPTIGENKFVINGDGFKNQLVQLEINATEFKSNYYSRGVYNYNQDNQNVVLEVSGGNKVLPNAPITGLQIDFNKFNGTGKYTLDSAVSFSIFFKKDIPTNEYENHYVIDSDCEINIKAYGPVGGIIEGTFSGIFTKMVYNKVTGEFIDTDITVEIKDGKFSAIHSPDYHWDAPISTGKEPEAFKEKKKKSKKS